MRPGLKMPAGSNAAFNCRCRRSTTGSSGGKQPTLLVRGAKQRCMTFRAARSLAHRVCGHSRLQPAQGAVPFDQLTALQLERRRGRGNREAPQRLFAGEERHRCARARRTRTPASVDSPPSAVAAARTAAADAGKPHAELAVVPRTGAERQRLPGPAVHQLERARLRRLEHAASSRAPARGATLSETSAISPSVPSEPAMQARHVVTGDVLHHLAAEAEHLPAAVDQLYAEHEVAQRARACPPWARQAGGHAAADGRAGAEMRRFEGQHLLVCRERRFELAQAACRSFAVTTSSVGS